MVVKKATAYCCGQAGGRGKVIRPRAFTLIELLVVVSIIALLVSILMPALKRARLQAWEVTCLSNLHHQGLIFMTYAGDNEGRFPKHDNWWPEYVVPGSNMIEALKNYVGDPEVLYCRVCRRRTGETSRIDGPDCICLAWPEYGGWNRYLSGESQYIAITYDWFFSYQAIDGNGDPVDMRYYNGNKRVRRMTDMRQNAGVASDQCRPWWAMDEPEAMDLDWGLIEDDWDVSINGIGVNHDRDVGGINVLNASLGAEKRLWSELQLKFRIVQDGGSFFYW